ncbi:hypothetical protein AAHC03_013471 [Spirometra sp. Aus1]
MHVGNRQHQDLLMPLSWPLRPEANERINSPPCSPRSPESNASDAATSIRSPVTQVLAKIAHSTPKQRQPAGDKIVGELVRAVLELQLSAELSKLHREQQQQPERTYNDSQTQNLEPRDSISQWSFTSSLPKTPSSSDTFSPPVQPLVLGLNLTPVRKGLYKTELCKRYLLSKNQMCEYGLRCRFAHGLRELHLTARHPRYKTEVCRAFCLSGYCRYGRRCDFIHDESPEHLRALRIENALYQEYCARHPNAIDVTLVEVLREFAPHHPELKRFLQYIESVG